MHLRCRIMGIFYEGASSTALASLSGSGHREGNTLGLAVSIGICAYNEEKRISGLLESLLCQRVDRRFSLDEILIVASGCSDGTEMVVRDWALVEPRIHLIREPERNGKVSALNLILAQYRGDILVLVNADARLHPEALWQILSAFLEPGGVEIACGRPIPELSSGGPRELLTGFLWRVHNRTLQTLSTLGIENHCCDEFMAIRRGFVTSLPPNLMHDGAYLGVLAARRGCTVRFCSAANVSVEIQKDLKGVLRHRRRTIWAHRQIEGFLDYRSNTLRSVAKRKPGLAARILGREFVERPSSILTFALIALPMELLATLLAFADSIRGKPYQAAWPVVD